MVTSNGFTISQVDVDPQPVASGGIVDINVELNENLEFMDPFDKDLCNPDGILQTTGANIWLKLEIDGSTDTETTVCLPVFNFSRGQIEVKFRYDAPQIGSGTKDIPFTVYAAPGHDHTDTERVNGNIRVSAEGAGGDNPDGDGGGSNFTKWVMEHPAESAGLALVGTIVVRSATKTALGE